MIFDNFSRNLSYEEHKKVSELLPKKLTITKKPQNPNKLTQEKQLTYTYINIYILLYAKNKNVKIPPEKEWQNTTWLLLKIIIHHLPSKTFLLIVPCPLVTPQFIVLQTRNLENIYDFSLFLILPYLIKHQILLIF